MVETVSSVSCSRSLPLACALLLLSLAAPPTLARDSAEPYELPRLTGEMVLDGRLDEEAWQRIEPFALVQYQPLAGANPSEATEIRIAYDDEYLYAAGRFVDTDPDAVRSNSLQRDERGSDDLFGLVLDSFNDNENAVAFFTNPAGTRIDETVANDAQWSGSRPFNRSWNTFWDSAARRTDEGWTAEMRIPFTSLRFQNTDDRVVMGLIAWRYIARKNETSTYPAIDAKWNQGHMKPSQARDVVLRGVGNRSPVYVTPYLLTGSSDQLEIADDDRSFEVRDRSIEEVGVDVKMALTSNLNLDLTFNTDFAQVEADDAQVNLSRFSLFQPEKRQFFQERSSLFDFGTGGPSRLFYSRRIGLGEDGEAVPIVAGVRLVGRVGDWDLGFLDMQTERLEGDEPQPAENFGVLRLRRRVLNDGSYVGGMLTSRIADGGGFNLAYGLDSMLRFSSGEQLTLRWAQTFDREGKDGDVESGLDSARLFALFENPTREGFSHRTVLAYTGENYQPDLGFAARTDFIQLGNEVRYGWLGDDEDSYQRRSAWLDGNVFWRESLGFFESADYGGGLNRQTKAGAWWWFDARAFYENLEEGFELGDGVEVEAGEHTYFILAAGGELPPGRDFQTWFNIRVGSFFDGERWGFRIGPEWTVSKHFQVGGMYDFNALRFDDRDQRLDIHLARLKLRYSFNDQLSVDLFAQFSSLAERVSSNLRLRYNFREGTDLYLVYTESQVTDRDLDTLRLPASAGRTLLLKYGRTLAF